MRDGCTDAMEEREERKQEVEEEHDRYEGEERDAEWEEELERENDGGVRMTRTDTLHSTTSSTGTQRRRGQHAKKQVRQHTYCIA